MATFRSSRCPRLVATSLIAITAVTAGVSTAAAGPRAMPRAVLARAAAVIPHSNLRAMPGLSRLLGNESSNQSFVSMVGAPVPVTVNGVTYTMYFEADAAAFGFPADASTDLERTVRSGGQVTGVQDHLYLFAPQSGLTFNYDAAALSSAHVNSGASLDPTKLGLTYTADAPVIKTGCQIFTGGRGVLETSTGKITAKHFKLATGTSPFFGNLTSAPQTATLISDPGCVDSSIGGAFSRYQPCVGSESIDTNGTATQLWASDLGYRGKQAVQVMLDTPPGTTAAFSEHITAGQVSGADMPPAVHGPHAAYARLLTEGNPFFGGSALFVSHTGPKVTGGHVCSYERETHRFVVTRYTGVLQPTGASPLTALFDTGAVPLTAQPATLYVRRYVS